MTSYERSIRVYHPRLTGWTAHGAGSWSSQEYCTDFPQSHSFQIGINLTRRFSSILIRILAVNMLESSFISFHIKQNFGSVPSLNFFQSPRYFQFHLRLLENIATTKIITSRAVGSEMYNNAYPVRSYLLIIDIEQILSYTSSDSRNHRPYSSLHYLPGIWAAMAEFCSWNRCVKRSEVPRFLSTHLATQLSSREWRDLVVKSLTQSSKHFWTSLEYIYW